MAWQEVVQFAGIAALAVLGTALVAVGAYGSGVVSLVVGSVWFWRLYRAAD